MSWDLDFSRQTCLPEVGEEGQARLRKAKVLVVGAGGTGSPAIMYLASAGLGRVDVCDPDWVDASNMHRQILYTDVGSPKVAAAQKWVQGRGVQCTALFFRMDKLTESTARSESDMEFAVEADYDVILDCTDRWSSHRNIVMSGLYSGRHVVHGSIGGLVGRVITFSPKTPCWWCLHPDSPKGVEDVPRGTLGPVCGLVGSAMAMEAIQVCLGRTPALLGRMLAIDASSMNFHSFDLSRREGCTGCSIVQDGH